jgi:hypothetical protein
MSRSPVNRECALPGSHVDRGLRHSKHADDEDYDETNGLLAEHMTAKPDKKMVAAWPTGFVLVSDGTSHASQPASSPAHDWSPKGLCK